MAYLPADNNILIGMLTQLPRSLSTFEMVSLGFATCSLRERIDLRWLTVVVAGRIQLMKAH